MRSAWLLAAWLLAALVSSALLTACGPGIAGQWKGSGEIDRDNRFELDLSLESEVQGKAIYTAAPNVEPRTIEVCSGRIEDDALEFRLDLAGRDVPCSGAAQRYLFTGMLGEDVMTGDVVSTGGEPIGRWRAFRVKTD
jgi:hypothetical protein